MQQQQGNQDDQATHLGIRAPHGLKCNVARLIFRTMQRPIDVDLPHQLGKDEARSRIAGNIHKLEKHIPGGTSRVDSSWQGDTLNLTVHAMGQKVDAKIDVFEAKVHCQILLPGMLSLFAAPIEAMLRQKGGPLLLEDDKKKT